MRQGSILGANKIQPRICHFCRAEQKGVFRGPLALGTENGHGWELSSQISVGMSSHYINLGYSPSASAGKCSGKTAASLPERRSAEVMPHHAIH